ncbi:MAG: holo-ACP synthase [Bacteroidota bacterium]|jgi:holo-[acyl-carrier protein] synthase
MIVGIGIDLIDVARIEKLIVESSGFKERVFSPTEIDYCDSGKNRFERYAARFAAKEAFAKATGLGIFGSISMNEVFVIHQSDGKPELQFSTKAKSILDQIGIDKIHLSLSHSDHSAIATVVLEKM